MTYIEEQSIALENVLDNVFYKPWQQGNADTSLALSFDNSIAFCDSCLFANENKTNHLEEYNNNLISFLEFLLNKNCVIPKVKVNLNFDNEIDFNLLNTIVNYGYMFNIIKIKTSSEFLMDLDKAMQLQKMSALVENLNTKMIFDVYLNIETINDELLEHLFVFQNFNTVRVYSYITPQNINIWQNAYNKLEEYCNLFDLDILKYFKIIVDKNSVWDSNSKELLFNFINSYLDKYTNEQIFSNLLNHSLTFCNFSMQEDCDAHTTLNIYIPTLAIIPCSGLNKHKYVYGYYQIDDGHISGLIENNLAVAIRILKTDKIAGAVKCDTCVYHNFCHLGCYANQFKYENDPFIPYRKTCDIEQFIIDTILKIIKSRGILKQLGMLRDNNYHDLKKELMVLYSIDKKEKK